MSWEQKEKKPIMARLIEGLLINLLIIIGAFILGFQLIEEVVTQFITTHSE